MYKNRYYYIIQDSDTGETFNLQNLWSHIFRPHIFTTLRTAIGVINSIRWSSPKKHENRNIEIVYIKVEKIEPISWKDVTELDRLMTQKNEEITLEQYNTL